MGIHIRQTRMIAVVGVLALGGASVVAAQDTSAASRHDTSGYQQSGSQTDTMQAGAARSGMSDTSQYNPNGASTDTALKAKPGVQTGPTAGDSSRMHGQDTSSYKSSGSQDTSSYKSSGSQDTSSYKSSGSQDTSSYKSSGNQADTTGRVNKTTRSGYQYHGPGSDTALDAKAGTQTGPAPGDTGRMHRRRHHMRMSAMDTVVCKDGSNSANSKSGACGAHGGVDTAATWAAMKARGGWHGRPGAASDTGMSKSRTSSDTGMSKSRTSSDTSMGKSSTSTDTSSSSTSRSSP
jgi:hypothetical protein